LNFLSAKSSLCGRAALEPHVNGLNLRFKDRFDCCPQLANGVLQRRFPRKLANVRLLGLFGCSGVLRDDFSHLIRVVSAELVDFAREAP
jgi:hypothetical protein